jgi:hypothetical protein
MLRRSEIAKTCWGSSIEQACGRIRVRTDALEIHSSATQADTDIGANRGVKPKLVERSKFSALIRARRFETGELASKSSQDRDNNRPNENFSVTKDARR